MVASMQWLLLQVTTHGVRERETLTKAAPPVLLRVERLHRVLEDQVDIAPPQSNINQLPLVVNFLVWHSHLPSLQPLFQMDDFFGRKMFGGQHFSVLHSILKINLFDLIVFYFFVCLEPVFLCVCQLIEGVCYFFLCGFSSKNFGPKISIANYQVKHSLLIGSHDSLNRKNRLWCCRWWPQIDCLVIRV
jgi:hypothetical protein